MNNKQSLILFIIIFVILAYILYRLPSVEQMSNVDKATEDKIRDIYKIDTDAIRNLSNLAKDLTVNGKLVVPGGLEIKGNLKVGGSTETVNQTKTKNLVIDKGSDDWGGGMTVYGGKNEPFYINYFTNDNRNVRKGYVMLGNGNSSNVLFSGNLKVNGFTEQLGGGSVEGKLYYRHTGANGSDDTDPYFIEKVRTSADNNHLRLTINDNPDESFQIWGNSCGSDGGCGGQGRVLLKLNADGNLHISGDALSRGQSLIKHNDSIHITTHGTPNHPTHGRYMGLCGWGHCNMVNVGMTNDKGISHFKIIKY